MTHAPHLIKNMIAIASGKGGVGKTFFSTSLAHALARQGKKVLLFDGDLGLANIDVQLGLMAKHDLGAVIDGTLALNRAITRYEDGGFDIIVGRSGFNSLALLSADLLGKLIIDLAALASHYDYVLIDLAAGVDRAVRQLANVAALNLVVVTDEPTSLTDAYAFIKLSHQAGTAPDFKIVVNMAADLPEGKTTYDALTKACQNFLKFTPALAGIIRRDPKVKECIRHQTSVFTRYPNTEAAMDVEKIALTLVT